MRGFAAAGLAIIAAFATPAFGQSFLGDWTATAHSPAGDFAETLKVSKAGDGYAVRAKLSQALPAGTPEAGPGENVVLDGDHFSYTRTVTTDGGSLKITYSGTVAGDSFDGKVEIGGAGVPYTGVRIKPGQ